MKCRRLLSPLLLVSTLIDTKGFQPATSHLSSTTKVSSTVLYRAFHKKNKQADLLEKLNKAKEERKKEKGEGESEATNESENSFKPRLSDEEIKKANDLKRFDEMLGRDSATINYELDGTSTNYLTKQQEEDEIDAGFRRVDQIFEGDPAPTDPFQDLVSIQTDLALGEAGSNRIVPWLHKSPSKHKDYLVVVSDPRIKSSELRDLMNIISTRMPDDILSKIVVINSDTPAENRRWLKKRQVKNLTIFSDVKREWMREYTAMGEKRWDICMFIIADGRVQKVVRELDANIADKVIKGAINSLVN